MGSIDQEPAFVIPTVDISPYLSNPNSPQAKGVVAQIKDACITSGFFQIIGHGVSRDLQDATFEAAKVLFALPQEEKEGLRGANGRGYEVLGSQTLQEGAKPDMKEVCQVAIQRRWQNHQLANQRAVLGIFRWSRSYRLTTTI
jgi:isopenicillin N synthase-like dioxygenase